MAHDEDPVDELRSVGMTSAAAISRVAETMIRAAEDAKLRAAQEAAQQAEDGQRRYDAQAHVADRFYREAIDKDLMTTSPRLTRTRCAKARSSGPSWTPRGSGSTRIG